MTASGVRAGGGEAPRTPCVYTHQDEAQRHAPRATRSRRVVTKTGVCVVALLGKVSNLAVVATPSIHPVLVTTRLMRSQEIAS